MANLAATDGFYEAIKEIELLITYSKSNQRNTRKYQTFNKAATVLLCSKFESFVENFLDEYAYELIRKTTNKTLCDDLLEHIIDNLMSHLEKTKNNKRKRRQHIDKLIVLCSDIESTSLESYRDHVDSKLKMGKHGQNEIERLLTKFGFGSILGSPTMIEFFKQLNSLMYIRHNIVHEDVTPSLTHTDVKNYLLVVDGFVKEIQNKANEILITV